MSRDGDSGWRVSEKLPVSACVCARTRTCVSPGTASGEDLISDFGRLCAGVLPLGGDTVRCQMEFERAYQWRICPSSMETNINCLVWKMRDTVLRE